MDLLVGKSDIENVLDVNTIRILIKDNKTRARKKAFRNKT